MADDKRKKALPPETVVLVIEDDLEVMRLIMAVLRGLGADTIHRAPDGQEGLRVLAELRGRLDLVICDWGMPGMTGIELLQHLRQHGSRIPFLMVTGRADKSSVLEARDLGVSAYIAKPFTIGDLEMKILTLLGRHDPADGPAADGG